MTTNRRPRGERAEGIVQVLILLAIGGCAAAASFTHVHNVAASHGQPGWLAWADAVVLEQMSIAAGLEIRRRHRNGQPAGFVLGVLIGAVALSLSAQVVEAEPSVIGWLAGALPALGFLACIKIVLTRSPGRPRQDQGNGQQDEQDEPFHAPTTTRPTIDITPPLVSENAQNDVENGRSDVEDEQDKTVTDDRLDRARTVAAEHRATVGKDITRDELRATLGVATTTASDLLRQVRTETGTRPALPPMPATAFTRLNGHQPAGGDQ